MTPKVISIILLTTPAVTIPAAQEVTSPVVTHLKR